MRSTIAPSLTLDVVPIEDIEIDVDSPGYSELYGYVRNSASEYRPPRDELLVNLCSVPLQAGTEH